MFNCSNLIKNKSLKLLKQCNNNCSSIINKCFCNCIYEKNNINNINNNNDYTYVLYDSTITSYVLFSVLLFFFCICVCICSCKYRTENLIKKNNEKYNEKYNLLNQEPPTYDSILLDLD